MPTYPASTAIKWALAELDPACDRLKNYDGYCAYYEGRHPMAFAGERYRNKFWKLFRTFSLNMTSSVVDVQTERLEIVGFVSDKSSFDEATLTTEDTLGEKAWNAWEAGRLDLVADRVHHDALLYGDGFLIAQPQGDSQIVWPQEPHQIAVHYTSDVPSTIDMAAKLYHDNLNDDERLWTLLIYQPGEVVRYTATVSKDSTDLKPDKFNPTGPTIVLPDGMMPVYHFPNKAIAGYGHSELADVLPIQDALNKTVIDMLVSSEYQAFRQRWATGAENDDGPAETVDPTVLAPYQVATDGSGRVYLRGTQSESGPGDIIMFPDPETRVGEFGQMDVGQFINAKNAFQADIARVSGVPLSYFFVSTSETPSGEALKAGETRFTRKGDRQKRAFGNHWEHVIAAVAGIDPAVDLNTVWDDNTSRSETEKLNALVLKQTLGVPNEALWKELGYDDAEIKAFSANQAANQPPPAPDGPPVPAADPAKREQQPPSPQAS